MKKYMKTLSLFLAALFLLAACSSGPSSQNNVTPPAASQSVPDSGTESSSAKSNVNIVTAEDVKPNFEFQETVVYTGSGDDVIEIQPSEKDIWVLTIKGNSEGKHFAVKGYDDKNESTELFVNTTEPYIGTTMDSSFTTTVLEVSATGDWEITLHSVSDMQWAKSGDAISGFGDTIINVEKLGKTAHITGNENKNHFAVKTYGLEYDDLLVNTVDPYDGTVMLKGEPILLIVNSESEWEIKLN